MYLVVHYDVGCLQDCSTLEVDELRAISVYLCITDKSNHGWYYRNIPVVGNSPSKQRRKRRWVRTCPMRQASLVVLVSEEKPLVNCKSTAD